MAIPAKQLETNAIDSTSTPQSQPHPVVSEVIEDPTVPHSTTATVRRLDGIAWAESRAQVQNVRHLMRRLVHPVALITSTDISIDPEGSPVSWKGATVSSFNTVTLSPVPIVSFNIKKLSSTYEAITKSGLFHVHLLDSTDGSAVIARKFSKGNKSSPFHTEDGSLEWFAKRQSFDKQRMIAHGRLRYMHKIGRAPPLIKNGPQVHFHLHCKHLPQKTVEIEDHVVVFGEVNDSYPKFHKLRPSSVLLYYVDGKYCPPISATESGNVLARSPLLPSEEHRQVEDV